MACPYHCLVSPMTSNLGLVSGAALGSIMNYLPGNCQEREREAPDTITATMDISLVFLNLWRGETLRHHPGQSGSE